MRRGSILPDLRCLGAAAMMAVSSVSFAAFSLSPSTESVVAGETFVTTLSADSLAGHQSFDFLFEFDATKLDLQNIELAPGAPEPSIPIAFEPGTGQKTFGFFFLDPLTEGAGPLALATFKALDSAVGATSIRVRGMVNEVAGPFTAPVSVDIAAIPEPGTVASMLAGLSGLAFLVGVKRRFRRT